MNSLLQNAEEIERQRLNKRNIDEKLVLYERLRKDALKARAEREEKSRLLREEKQKQKEVLRIQALEERRLARVALAAAAQFTADATAFAAELVSRDIDGGKKDIEGDDGDGDGDGGIDESDEETGDEDLFDADFIPKKRYVTIPGAEATEDALTAVEVEVEGGVEKMDVVPAPS